MTTDKKLAKEVLKDLNQFTPLKRDIKKLSVTKLPQYVKQLMKSPNKLQAFLANPSSELKAAKIDPRDLDLEMVIDLVKYLQLSKEGKAALGWDPERPSRLHIGAQIKQKETDNQQKWDFQHKKSKYTKYETFMDYNIGEERGVKATKERGEHLMKDKGFEEKAKKKGIDLHPELLLRPDLRNLYFPDQPMVTPELVAKIRRLIK